MVFVFKFQINWVWEFILFFSILLFAHFQAAIIPILLGIRSINKFKHISKNKFIPFGFVFLGLASISEMIDHTQTNWIYVDHSSLFNWLFYSFLSLGLTCLSISVIKNKFIQKTNIFISLCSIISYFLFKLGWIKFKNLFCFFQFY
jgi:hypothetical protein